MSGIVYTLTAQEACEAAGITWRTLDYWIEQGWFTPELGRRRYTPRDVDGLRALAVLSRKGKAALAAEVIAARARLVEETARRLAAEDELARQNIAEVQYWPDGILDVYRARAREQIEKERSGA
jgi:DNA-binding transcriptional MerR regulator